MIITALYVILILSTLAVIGVAIALMVRVKRHMSSPVDQHHKAPNPPGSDQTQP